MRLTYLLLAIPLLLLSACSSTPPPVKEITAAPIIKKDFAQILDNNFKGLFYLQDNKAYFSGCGTEQKLPAHASDSIRKIYEKITSKRALPVYIEFTGEIVFANNTTAEPNALMDINRVHHMALAKTSLQCAKPVNTFRFKAKGDEPYWRLSINAQKLYFANKVRNQVYQIQDSNFQTTQFNTVKSISKQGERLNLTIKPGHCYDLKNSEYWGYTAKVETIWGNLQGCGELGWPVLEQKFTGYYLNKTPARITNLTLNEDYTVEYSEKTGNKTIMKTGFWKSNSPNRVVVMLTRLASQKIREELIFQRKGLALSTTQINKDNIVTNLEAPGLLFNKMNSKQGVEETVTKYVERYFNAQRVAPAAELDLEIQEAVSQYFKIHRTDPKNSKFNAVKYDLNGDGIKEAIVLLDWCSKNGCEMLIFEGRSRGYRFSSRVSQVHAPITIARTQHYLWQSLLIEKNGQTLLLDFDGISYPIHTGNLKTVNKEDYSTGVILFSQGRPQEWFPISH
jgi:putative lipoprotein